jgi:Trypsin-like peptidase domain
MAIEFPISILKTLWERRTDGKWGLSDVKGLTISADDDSDKRFFILRGDVQAMTQSPKGRLDVLSLIGTPDFLMQQSIVPVVAWLEGEHSIRCIGTASIISCTGYLVTAAHVLMDPLEIGYGAVRVGTNVKFHDSLNFGVLIPVWVPGIGMTLRKAFRFFPFEKRWNWGEWRQSPLLHENDRWEHLTDVAVCKIPEMSDGMAHQPLNMSLNPFVRGEDAYALGYAEMPDIQLDPQRRGILDSKFRLNLHVSVGNIITTFPQNHIKREVPTPGPCFDFDARIPGRMSGAPIFGAKGAVVRGIVSRSFSGENHAYGSMLGPAMDLGLDEPPITGPSLRNLLEGGNEGMTKAMGNGL